MSYFYDPFRFWNIYFKLPKESFENLMRSMDMYVKLHKAWQDISAQILPGEITAEKLYDSLLPTLKDIYSDLFEFLFGPEYLVGPFGAKSLEAASNVIDFYKSILEAWENMAKTSWSSKEVKEYFGLLSTAWGPFDVFFRPFFALFLFPPKELVSNWSKLLDTYKDALKHWSDYYSKLYEAWMDASKRFAKELAGLAQEGKPITFKEFHEAWFKVFQEVYLEVIKSPEVISLQTLLMGNSMDLIAYWKKVLEVALNHMQILPIPTKSEIDEISKVIYQLKRELNLLTKKVETLTRTGSSQSG